MTDSVHRCRLCGWTGTIPVTDPDRPGYPGIVEVNDHMREEHPEQWREIQAIVARLGADDVLELGEDAIRRAREEIRDEEGA